MAKSNREGKALVLSQRQLNTLFEELKYPHNAIASLCYWTASRAGEIVALPLKAVQQDFIIIKQTKNKAIKEIDYYPELRGASKGDNLTLGYMQQ